MKAEMTKSLRKTAEKYGSVLAAFRSQGGAGKGLAAGGIAVVAMGILIGVPLLYVNFAGGLVVLMILAVPGIAMAIPGAIVHKVRMKDYLEYYHKQTGYSIEELRAADQELMSPDAVKIVSRTSRSGVRPETVFIITPHYFLSVWAMYGCYLRRLDDIVAAFYSNEIPGINGFRRNLFVITRWDIRSKPVKNAYTGKQYMGFENAILSDMKNCREVCEEAVAEIAARAPHIITCQNIIVKGVRYNLISMDDWQRDWTNILEG